ncbi:MAG: hypothetical protein L0G39_13120 [Chryseobacterium sp.]|uniref:hypothetical protein n=1 Tax=Chryseobacterium carnipullorum TaxID=1124835 RepID=UPI00091DC663|nr:hypothetical protein [Chryseobacterium carnipullorum]MDN5395392.1 hypothetical protein [Chryseobacterium sp.]MDN5477870.1 hypothetical protein [Chryseobacterium sp.]SHL55502.1 hypothetical protein SAMN05444360_102304 [Chryseobacterium carnipullorum]
MYSPTRRNRNIGTENQGYSQNNKLTISSPYGNLKPFYERLTHYQKEIRLINNHEFIFVIEETREHSMHSCSLNDIQKIIEQIPSKDYGDLKFIILRQPKRKEEILSPVWGRLIYSFEFENEYFPAVILDAIDTDKKLLWPKKQTIEDQKEFERLKADGHIFTTLKRNFIAEFKPEFTRNTQLYRTLLHEFGHYAHYLEVIKSPGNDPEEEENYDEKEKRIDLYFCIPKSEKENFAHTYADALKAKLIDENKIPFEPA